VQTDFNGSRPTSELPRWGKFALRFRDEILAMFSTRRNSLWVFVECSLSPEILGDRGPGRIRFGWKSSQVRLADYLVISPCCVKHGKASRGEFVLIENYSSKNISY